MAINWANLIGNGLSTWSSYQQSQQQGDYADAASGNSEYLAANQSYYNDQLKSLMADPAKFLDNPLYKAAFDQGTEAVTRGAASSGFLGSGNMAASLQQYGQSMASSYLLQQEQLLASLAGLGGSPISGLNTAATINQNSGNFLGDLVGELGNYYGEDITEWVGNLFGGSSGGTAADVDAIMSSETSGVDLISNSADGITSNTPSLGEAASGVGAVAAGADTLAGLFGAGSTGTVAITDLAGNALLGAGAEAAAGGTAATAAGAGAATESAAAGIATGTSSGTGIGAGLASTAGVAVVAVAAAAVLYGISSEIWGSHSATITKVNDDQTLFKLPNSPQSGLRQGNIGLGAGNDAKEGSGNYFLMDDETGLPKEWLGQEGMTTINQYLRTVSLSRGNPDLAVGGVRGVGGKTVNELTPSMQKLFDKYGGEAAWGTNFNNWILQLAAVRANVEQS